MMFQSFESCPKSLGKVLFSKVPPSIFNLATRNPHESKVASSTTRKKLNGPSETQILLYSQGWKIFSKSGFLESELHNIYSQPILTLWGTFCF